jgi:hypothetical protein
MHLTRLLFLFAALTLSASGASAQATSGTKTWGGFAFTWTIDNNAGVSLQDVSFNGTKYIAKASMPVIRVQYDTPAGVVCGPYMDRLGPANIIPENGSYVRFYELNGQLIVWIRSQIASYALEQHWVFNASGRIDSLLFSSGLQCVYNHRHHPYWRIDADVGDAVNDEIRVRYSDGRVFYVPREFNRNKLTSPAVSNWYFYDRVSGKRLTVTPGSADGNADGFASYDFYGRLYKEPLEHMPWAPNVGGYADQGDLVLGSNNNESIGPGSPSTDVVGWYVGHLFHPSTVGATQWQAVGPSLMLH